QAHRVNDNRVIAVQIENTDFQQCPVTGWSDQHCQVFIHHYASGCRANGMPYIDLDDAVLIRWLPIRTQTIYLVCVSLQRKVVYVEHRSTSTHSLRGSTPPFWAWQRPERLLNMSRVRVGPTVAASAVAVSGAVAAGWAVRNLGSYDRARTRARRAGFVQRQVVVNGATLNYAVGPGGDKPPLLLIHGQGVDWQSYAPVLPALAEEFVVDAVDVRGHGQSGWVPERYSAVAIGEDLARFSEQVIGTQIVVAGHSSGGQLAAWLAGNRPELARAAMLEDPPLFTTTLPRAAMTWHWVDVATTAHDVVRADETDGVGYSCAHRKLWEFFGESGPRIVRYGLRRHAKHPDSTITLWFMPPSSNEMQRAMRTYDPRFGEAFYTGR